ncbi:MAG: excinuclease ABC subunit UvrA [Nitrospirota bacterium]
MIIEGARQNNLKNISLSLPHNKVIAVTGLSGSGKSSLAFDTIFAEGQWRFIESLSTYARLFLEKLDRPDVDAIDNIRPAIALEQKNPVRGSRSTVGTLTELYDLFRLLYAKIATPHCPRCGKEIRTWDPSQIRAELVDMHLGEKALILFETDGNPSDLKNRGFQRIWLDNEVADLDSIETSFNPPQGYFTVVLDRLLIKDDPRLSDSLEMAWREGKGRLKVAIIREDRGTELLSFSSENSCEECGISVPVAYPLLFSFNHPIGACPECKGFGNILRYDEDLIVPVKSLSLADGAVDPWNKPAYRWWKNQLLKNAPGGGLDVRKRYSDLTEKEKALLFKGGAGFYGIDDFFEDLEGRRYKLHVRVFLSRYRKPVVCSQCNGKRLKNVSLAYKLSGLDIADLCVMPVSETVRFFRELDVSPFRRDMAKEILRQIELKLGFLQKVGIHYLSLSREGRTLSGGEYQRVNLANQIGSFLTGILYVLDEPTIGLHARDTEVIANIMTDLSKLGNTVLVVEHDRKIIDSADWIVELGPGGGQNGGEIVFAGPRDEFVRAETLTARYIAGVEKIEYPVRSVDHKQRVKETKKLFLRGASGNNLKSIDLAIPIGTLTAVTGVSGSGKSSVVVETLYSALAKEFKTEPAFPLPYAKLEGTEHIKGVKLIAHTPIGRSPRSNPVTYLKIFESIRKLFSDEREARTYGYGPGFFSFNVPGGRCETCKGVGYQKMEMYFFEDLYVSCEVCNGKKYRPEALRVVYRGKNIDEVLKMTVDEAVDFFHDTPKIRNKLLLMREIGLGYLRLGQPATTLSGGEAQRLKICAEMMNMPSLIQGGRKGVQIKGFLYILDEPTIGLHFKDVEALMSILERLVVSGNTVLIIEHNLDVIRAADWIIDLGPEGGDKGGRIIFAGRPEEIVKSKESYTGRYLREHVTNG